MRIVPKFIKLTQGSTSAYVRADTITTIESYSAVVPGNSNIKTTVTCASNGKTYGIYTDLTSDEIVALIEYTAG